MFRKIKDFILLRLFYQIENYRSKVEYSTIQNINFKKRGEFFNVGKDYKILNPQFIELGERFYASHRFRIEAISDYEGQKFEPHVIIGDNVNFNTDIHIGCIDKIEIGNNCLFASRIYITDHDHGDTSLDSLLLPPAKRRLVSKGPVIIKDNVWVGEGAAILSGVTIGENSIIATNTVVTKDVPANSVVGGIPAKIIKQIK
ncbi:acyltransferase [Cloacibacterium normanense]|uniref:acyltransferase n=1 Tax=Cloacibacterium normanense TaxID=237258 RepID=UPI00352F4514